MDSEDVIALGTSLRASKPAVPSAVPPPGSSGSELGPISSARQAASRRLEVRDDEGRRRFHGAFTGGFSAGYFNTVGSATGWEGPASFRSSRDQRHSFSSHDARAYMDDEDEAELLGAKGSVNTAHAYGGLGEKAMAEGRAVAAKAMSAKGPQTLEASVAADDIPAELLMPTAVPIGKQLLQQLGWRPGQPLGPLHQRRFLSTGGKSDGSAEHTTKSLYGLDPSLESLESLWAAAAARAPELDALVSGSGAGFGDASAAATRIRVSLPGSVSRSAVGLGYKPPPSLLAMIARDGGGSGSGHGTGELSASGRAAALRRLGHGVDHFDAGEADRGSKSGGQQSSSSGRLHLASVLAGTAALEAHRGGLLGVAGSSSASQAKSSGGLMLTDRLASGSYGEDGDGDDDFVPLHRGAGFDMPMAGHHKHQAAHGHRAGSVSANLLLENGHSKRRPPAVHVHGSATMALADDEDGLSSQPPPGKRLRLTDSRSDLHSSDRLALADRRAKGRLGNDEDNEHDDEQDGDDHGDDRILTFVPSAKPLEADITSLAARFPAPFFPPGFAPPRHAFSPEEDGSFAAAMQAAAAAAVEREQLLRHGRGAGAGGGLAGEAHPTHMFTAAGRMSAAAEASTAQTAAAATAAHLDAAAANVAAPPSAKQRTRLPDVQPGLGRAARVVTPWVPSRLLLRRFNVADPLSKEARQAAEAAAAMAAPQLQSQTQSQAYASSRNPSSTNPAASRPFDAARSVGAHSHGGSTAASVIAASTQRNRGAAAGASVSTASSASSARPARTGGLSFTVASEVLDAGAGMESLGVGLQVGLQPAPGTAPSSGASSSAAISSSVSSSAVSDASLQHDALSLLRSALGPHGSR